MVITLGSFDNLKQELTTVDFRAVVTYGDVWDLSLPIFVKLIDLIVISGERGQNMPTQTNYEYSHDVIFLGQLPIM